MQRKLTWKVRRSRPGRSGNNTVNSKRLGGRNAEAEEQRETEGEREEAEKERESLGKRSSVGRRERQWNGRQRSR